MLSRSLRNPRSRVKNAGFKIGVIEETVHKRHTRKSTTNKSGARKVAVEENDFFEAPSDPAIAPIQVGKHNVALIATLKTPTHRISRTDIPEVEMFTSSSCKAVHLVTDARSVFPCPLSESHS